jgi:DNA polymerase-1
MMLERDPNCARCKLHETAEYVCLLGNGPRNGVMVIGEAPGHREDATGTAFVGQSGRLLRRTLEEFGVDAYIGNAVNCRPPDNRTPSRSEIKACRYWMKAQLEDVRPKFVLLLGNVALESVLEVKGIMSLRGKPIERDGITYFPAYHPSFVLRDPTNEPIFRKDIEAFAALTRGQSIEEVTEEGLNPIIVDTRAKLEELKRDLHGHVSFDLETSGIYPWQAEIVSVGFGTRNAQYMIPWSHPESPWNDLDAIVKELDPLIQDCIISGQNIKFDFLFMLVHHGVQWSADFDIMLAHYALDENDLHDLEHLSKIKLGVEPYDVPLDVKQGKHGFAPLAKYQSKDLLYTRQIKLILQKELTAEPGVKKVFEKILMPCSRLFVEVEYDGLFIDISKFDEAEKYLVAEKASALASLKKWEPEEWLDKKGRSKEFNWGSPQQIGELLYNRLNIKCPQKTPKGGNSTSESTLNQIDHPLVDDLIKFRGAKQQLSFFIDGWRPWMVGRYLHPSFKLHGTVTGRLSAEHPNPQQTPRDERIRQLVSAPPGWELIEADLSQIELRIAAELANERAMLYAFNHGIDIHWLTLMRELGRTAGQADEIVGTACRIASKNHMDYGEAIDLLLKVGPDVAAEHNKIWKELRKKAKAINFGYLYGMWWRKFIIYARDNYQVKVSESQAKKSRESFFETYKDLPAWHKRQQNYARRNGFVISLSGRKRRLPDAMDSEDTPARAEAWRQAINSPVQSFANELNLMSALQLREEYGRDKVRICGTVHDSILARVKKAYVVEVGRRLLEIMRHPKMLDEFGIELKVPIEAELKVGPWGKGVSLEKWVKANAQS